VLERSLAPLRYTTKKVRTISQLLIMEQDSIYRQLGLTVRVYDSVYHQPNIRMSSFLAAHALRCRRATNMQVMLDPLEGTLCDVC
jgi:hypothetical protein